MSLNVPMVYFSLSVNKYCNYYSVYSIVCLYSAEYVILCELYSSQYRHNI